MSALAAAVRAEFTKLLTLRSVWLGTAAILALHGVICAANLSRNRDAVAGITPDGMIELFAGRPQPARHGLVDFMVAASFQMSLFLPILAAVMAGQEFRNHQLGQSLLAVPNRGRLVVAKTLAVAGHLLVLSVLVCTISAAFLYATVQDRYPGLVFSADAWRGEAKFVTFAVLTGLVTMAFAMLARSTLGGALIAVGLIMLTMTQVLAALASPLDALLPLSAGRNLLLDPAQNHLSAGPGVALVVLVAWPLVTVATAWTALARRDAR